MDLISTVIFYSVALYVVYKILDHLIHIPRIGNYKDRYVLITGCDTGFGNAAAQRLDKLGCNVFAGCLTETGETELRKVCSERLHTVTLDVTKPESVRQAFEFVCSKLPHGKGLWGIVNNAGILGSWGAPDWLSLDDYRKVCDVNLWGLIDVTLVFLPLVKKAKGRIVNTASAFGRFTSEVAVPYCISKYGVESFSDGLRKIIFHFGCDVSMVEPGAFLTNIVNLQSMLDTAVKTWKNAPEQIRADYGEECAKYITDITTTNHHNSSSADISLVVDAYEHGLFGVFPRARYVVGWDAKWVYLCIQMLPEWLGDRIWRLKCKIPPPKAVSN